MASTNGASFNTSLFNGQDFVGEVAVSTQSEQNNLKSLFGKEIRCTSFSPSSERCSPLLVLHTISSDGPLFKISSSSELGNNQLTELWTICYQELKTAMLLMGDGAELHLVAMTSRAKIPCFWAFRVAEGLYASCLSMLNLRCLAMVFDLDETLIVANTMRSFEDRVEILERKFRGELDPQRQSIIAAELKRYQEDRSLLKQYVESDQIFEGGKLLKAQQEIVPPASDGLLPILRPIIRLPEHNMVLTRINPSVRDTSVLVRLRPAWEELRNYITAKGRKRFEVFICTMSEKDYAMEMWRLLDPEGRLIEAREIQERLSCVKSGSKKSLLNVFSRGRCLHKLAMVIDDRLKVWEDQDQAHVHVVPPFAPYYAPQAETSLPLPILCIARNVACSVRNSFFKEFDENLSQELAEVHFDSDWSLLAPAPDASKYLLSESLQDELMPLVVGNGVSKDFPDGMTDSEVEARIHPQVEAFANEHLLEVDKQVQISPSIPPGFRVEPSTVSHIDKSYNGRGGQVAIASSLSQSSWQQSPFQKPPSQEEGEVPESDLDPDTRRRLLILRHGQDTGPIHVADKMEGSVHRPKLSLQIRIPAGPSPGGWLGEEELSPDQPSRSSPGILLEPESPSFETQRMQQSTLGQIAGSSIEQGQGNIRQQLPEKMLIAEPRLGSDLNSIDHPSRLDEDEDQLKAAGIIQTSYREMGDPVQRLREIAQSLSAVVEYKSQLDKTTADLRFTVEVFVNGKKISESFGKSNREARCRAAILAISTLTADSRSQSLSLTSRIGSRNLANPHIGEEDRLPLWSQREPYSFTGAGPMLLEEDLSSSRTGGKVICRAGVEEIHPTLVNAVLALKDLCTIEGFAVSFSKVSIQLIDSSKIYTSQVEVAGKVLGKGSGFSWEMSEQEAAKEALRNLKMSHSGVALKRMKELRSPLLQTSKRAKAGPSSPGPASRVSPKRYTKVGTSIS